MSYTVQAAEPNASPTVRGVMVPADKIKLDALSGTNTGDVTLAAVGSAPSANGASLAGQVLTLQPADGTRPGVLTAGAQTIGGVKTFNSKVIVGPQGGNALELDGNDAISWSGQGSILGFGGMLYSAAMGFRTNGVAGFWMGGVNSSFSSAGLYAYSQGHSVDIYQGQATEKTALSSAKGASAGAVVRIGTNVGTPHADAELLRVAYGLSLGGSGSDGTAVLKAMGDGRVIIGARNTAPADANLMAGAISFYLDEAGNNLKVRVKYADGTTLKTGTLALV